MIKIDIEGGEPYALAGAKTLLTQPHLSIIMEFAPSNFLLSKISPFEFLQNLGNFGFSIYKIGKKGKLEIILPQNLEIEKLMAGKESVNLFLKK